MGVKKYQLYTLSEHFKQRAKLRFSIEDDKCQKWFNSVAQRAKEYKELQCPNPNRVAYITSDRILFILDATTYTAITCYPAKDKKKEDLADILSNPEVNQTDVTESAIEAGTTPITESLLLTTTTSVNDTDDEFPCLDTQDTDIHVSKEDKFIDINNNNYASFKEEVLRLERRANLKNAKEFLSVIEEDVERFYKNYQRVKNGVLSDKNYGHLQELNQDINVIADAFRTLKKLEQNYKILDKNKQNYEQEIFEPIFLSETNGFYTKQ